MVPYLGDFNEDETVYIAFNTFSSDDPSASVTITNLADADIKVHKDGGTTQIATDGATVAINYDSITGNHLITIDTSAHSDYATGSDYHVRIEGTTVDGATINAWVGHFSILNRSHLRPTTAGRTLDVASGGEAGLDFGNTTGTIDAAQLGADCITAAKIADDAIAAEHVAANTIVAATLASDCITSAKIADDAIAAEHLASGAIVAATLAADCITAAKIADDALVAANFATGCLTADAFAADALVAATFATGAFTADAFASNALVAGTFASSSLDGKGDWNTTTPPTVAAIVNEWESQSQADPTGFHVNVKEVNGTGQTANDNGADINLILGDTAELQTDNVPGLISTLSGKVDVIDGIVDDILLDTAEIGTGGAGLDDLGGMSSAMKAEINTEVDTAFTTQMADSVPNDGTIATREQAIYMIVQMLSEMAISGTTMTVKKVNGSTTLMTFTLSDDTNPTSITRAG